MAGQGKTAVLAVARRSFLECGGRAQRRRRFGRARSAAGDLLKLYVWGYLNHMGSSRRLERECTRNLEVTWLMRKLQPDFKTIADFRKSLS